MMIENAVLQRQHGDCTDRLEEFRRALEKIIDQHSKLKIAFPT